jgi:hypothetical protein
MLDLLKDLWAFMKERKKILVITDHFSVNLVGRINCADSRFCGCPVYLHVILKLSHEFRLITSLEWFCV